MNLSTVCTLVSPPEVYAVSAVKHYTVVEGLTGRKYEERIGRFDETNTEPGVIASLPDLLIQSNIITRQEPVFSHLRHLAGERLEAANQEFNSLLEKGIIRP